MQGKKPIITNRFGLWVAIIVSFTLAILDMIFLRDGFRPLIGDGEDIIFPSFIAFLLATIANVSAFLWGYSKGHSKGEKKQGKSFMFAWIALGIVYAFIRASIILSDTGSIKTIDGELDFEDIIGQTIIAIVLAISYIGSGTTIQWAARQLFDADITEFRSSKKEFKKTNTLINNNAASLWEMVDELKKYDNNYKILDRQYDKEYDKIVKNEKSIMAQIVGKTIANNQEIDPVDANEVMEEVLNEREAINKKKHAVHQQISHR